MTFTRAQVEQLLRPINPDRVLKDGKGHSHVSQQDVLAHLIRVFGFGNFDTEIISGPTLLFETERTDPKTGKPNGRWDVCYSCTYRLVIKDETGREVCHFEDGSTATAQNQTRGDGHDLAFKSALSLAKKRAAIPLGDQFGLSLYNKGQLTALVRGTLVLPLGQAAGGDLQEGVPKQVALGNDEVERDAPEDADAGQATDHAWLDSMEGRIQVAANRSELTQLAREISAKQQAGECEQVHADHLWELGRQRQDKLGIAVNKDGSLSRSRMSDEALAREGAMTKAQAKEHNALRRDGEPKPEEIEHRTSVDQDDPWASESPWERPPIDAQELKGEPS